MSHPDDESLVRDLAQSPLVSTFLDDSIRRNNLAAGYGPYDFRVRDDALRYTARTHSLVDEWHHRIHDRLVGLLDDPAWLGDVASASYWHPNGFAKIVLDHDSSGGQMRLHVWLNEGVDDVHSHGWFYRSIVLLGELEETIFHESDDDDDDGDPMWCHIYRPIGDGNFTFVDPKPVRLVEESTVRWSRGQRSGGGPAHIHKFTATGCPAATLVHVGPIITDGSGVYRRTEEPSQIIKPAYLSTCEIARLIDFVLKEHR